jgi:tRNA synthetases class I (E and Q), anti-codon binding domain
MERSRERSFHRLFGVGMILDFTEGATEADETEITIPYDPKGMIPGERKVKFTRKVYIDSSDFREEDSAGFFRLAPGKTVCLLNVPFVVRATTFSKDSNGRVSDIRAIKAEGEEPKTYIHWMDASSGIKVVSRQYNPLFKADSPNSLDWKEALGGQTALTRGCFQGCGYRERLRRSDQSTFPVPKPCIRWSGSIPSSPYRLLLC